MLFVFCAASGFCVTSVFFGVNSILARLYLHIGSVGAGMLHCSLTWNKQLPD